MYQAETITWSDELLEPYFPQIVEPLTAYPRRSRGYLISEDSTGLIRVSYRAVGDQRTPTAVAQYALSNYNAFIESNRDHHASKFLAHADWLVSNAVPLPGEGVTWTFDFAWRTLGYRCPPGWRSAMTQGQVLSVLLRAAILTENVKYKQCAEMAFKPFTRSVANGGVAEYRSGDVLLQEYAVPNAATPLNGFIFALLGLYEYSKYTSDPAAIDIVNRAGSTLARRLEQFHLPLIPWSRYDDRFNWLASPYYHRLHVNQLRALNNVFSDSAFTKYADAWQGAITSQPLSYRVARRVFWLTWKSGRATQKVSDTLRAQQ